MSQERSGSTECRTDGKAKEGGFIYPKTTTPSHTYTTIYTRKPKAAVGAKRLEVPAKGVGPWDGMW
jgi:hypothetical protein